MKSRAGGIYWQFRQMCLERQILKKKTRKKSTENSRIKKHELNLINEEINAENIPKLDLFIKERQALQFLLYENY